MRAPFLRGEIQAILRAQQAEFKGVHGRERAKRLRAARADEIVGIHPIRIQYDPSARILRFQNIQRAQRCLLARAVAIVTQPDFRRVPRHQAGLLGRERRAQRCHNAFHAMPAQGNRVHISLNEHNARNAPLFFEPVHAVQVQALIEHDGLLRVQIFGLRVAHGAAAKAQHAPLRGNDGEHDPVAEHVERFAVFVDCQPGF